MESDTMAVDGAVGWLWSAEGSEVRDEDIEHNVMTRFEGHRRKRKRRNDLSMSPKDSNLCVLYRIPVNV